MDNDEIPNASISVQYFALWIPTFDHLNDEEWTELEEKAAHWREYVEALYNFLARRQIREQGYQPLEPLADLGLDTTPPEEDRFWAPLKSDEADLLSRAKALVGIYMAALSDPANDAEGDERRVKRSRTVTRRQRAVEDSSSEVDEGDEIARRIARDAKRKQRTRGRKRRRHEASMDGDDEAESDDV